MKGVRELQTHQLTFNFLRNPGTNNQTIYKHVREDKEIRDSQHGFVKNTLCQINLICFHGRVTGFGTEGKTFKLRVLILVRLLLGKT